MTDSNSLLINRYKRLYKLGQGGMGQVWKCHDTVLDIDVALKLLLRNSSDRAKQRFQREAKALAKLKHKNIVGILDFGVADSGEIYMVMEHISGVDLKEYIEKKGKLSVDETISITSQICDALRNAHARDLVHRDIKPSNILITEDENGAMLVKVVDFGTVLVEVEPKSTSTGALVGSPPYMSPEAASGQSVDARSDLYSLGCLMYECLTGKVLFKGDSPAQTLLMHRENPLPELPEVDNESLVSLVRNCLAKDPENRIQTAGALLNQLVKLSDSLRDEDFELVEDVPEVIGLHRSGLRWKVALVAVLILSGSFLYFNRPKSTGMVTKAFKVSQLQIEEKAIENLVERRDKPRFDIEGDQVTCSKGVDDVVLKEYLKSHPESLKYKSWLLKHTLITDDGVKLLCNNTIEKLFVPKTVITDKGLGYISTAKNLHHLDIRSCINVTAAGIRSLGNLPGLNSISIEFKDLNSDWTDAVIGIKSLTHLEYYGNLSVENIRKLKNLPRLESLQLHNPTEEQIEAVDSLGLDVFGVRGRVTKDALIKLTRMKLKILGLQSVEFDEMNYEAYLSGIDGPRSVVLPFYVPDNKLESIKNGNKKVDISKSKYALPFEPH